MGSSEGHETTLSEFFLPVIGETIEILPGSRAEVESIYQEIFQEGVYKKHGVAVRPGNVVVDVGANIGMFCLHAASSGRPDSDTAAGDSGLIPVAYYGFEAIPPVFEVLKGNLARMKEGTGGRFLKVEALFNVALGEHVHPAVPFTFFPRLPGNSTLNPKERIEMEHGIVDPYFFQGAIEYLVPMHTLSDFIERYGIQRVDFLKVDVEGAELMVLNGVKDAHWSRVWQVVVEVPDTDEEINQDDTIIVIKRVHLITHLLKKQGFTVNADFDSDSKNYTIYGYRS